ncbi:MAG: menaquinone-dependent protoporphyrinogen IX dehydrogenase [Gammaproteobacteria bacterium]
MARILILNWSIYGQTAKICRRLQEILRGRGHDVEVIPLPEFDGDLPGYDAIFIGASIRNGKHNPAVLDFIRSHQQILESKPSGFFSVSLVARKPGKDTAGTNPYMKAFLAKCPWKPDLSEVFGGDLDYQRYSVMDRNIIRFIMWITKGPTDPQTKAEYTDWDKVERFAGRMSDLAAGPTRTADASETAQAG